MSMSTENSRKKPDILLPQPVQKRSNFFTISDTLKKAGVIETPPDKSHKGKYLCKIYLDKVTHENIDEIKQLIAPEYISKFEKALPPSFFAVPSDIQSLYDELIKNFSPVSPVTLTGDIINTYVGKDKHGNTYTALTLTQTETGKPTISVYVPQQKLSESEQALLQKKEADDRITVTGTVSFYPRQGTIQILATAIEDAPGPSQYQLYLQQQHSLWEKAGSPCQSRSLISKLNGTRGKDGHLQKKNIAIITAPKALGLGDFMATINKAYFTIIPPRCITLTATNIISTMKSLRAEETFDILVILRGGGSRYDLLEFSSAELAKEIAAYPIPVVTAIGHEGDKPLCNDAATLAAVTPTAAAADLGHYFYATLRNTSTPKKSSIPSTHQTKQQQLEEENKRLREQNADLTQMVQDLNKQLGELTIAKNIWSGVKKIKNLFSSH